ncbi:MAG: transporter substrate-binding domain-containing protein [Magnetococcales bacterium]|nr:transporter substrate-binding domain-containing protein [Magnetococcales bacterium]
MMKRLCVLFLVVMLSGLSRLWAEEVACGEKPIHIAFFRYGFAYYEQKGQEVGLFPDITDELARRSGCTFSPAVVSIARMWEDLASGQLDMLIAGRQNPERDRFAWFIPYAVTKDYALLHKATAIRVQSLQDFLQQELLQFGTLRQRSHNSTEGQFVDQLRQAGRVQESATAEILLRKLQQGHIDATFMMPIVYRKIFQDLQVAEEITVQDWFPENKGYPAHLVLNKRRFSAGDVVRWQEIVAGMQQDGTFQRIFTRYVPLEEAISMTNF